MNIIHPGFYLKARISVVRCAMNNLLLRKCQMFDSILAYFDSIKSDNVLSQRIIGTLPNEIHQVYLTEREYACKSPFFIVLKR
jgi:predicted Rdx family selenoprotein